jgi:hypothetical protein
VATYHCTGCGKTRPGRFTRRKDQSFGGWSQGSHIPNYWCYTCLPEGDGRGEDMPRKKAIDVTPTKAITLPTKLPTKDEGLQLVQPLQDAVKALHILSEEHYQEADRLLARVTTAKRVWDEKMEPIIRPIRQGLDNLYALNREILKPLDQMAEDIKNEMKTFKRKELQALQEASRKKAEEEERLRREAQEKEEAAERAKTPQMRGKLQAQAERAQQQAEAVAQTAIPAPVRAEASSVRPVRKVRVADLNAFLRGIIDGYIPSEAVSVAQPVLNQAFKDDPDGMQAWPGVEVYDDIQIVGR